ncbi:MAG: DJ-1/PfpI family protein [Oscillospiraceae bacterium]|jgi:4-methyl-5(b-hydroxyethyl)-thiazole monophosphate biosynthesis|nr:DJ-1/PfpI family protein [Oscillospiraceae bacterium]
MIYLLLANGFEEIEALTPADLLRRAGKQVFTVSIDGGADAPDREVTGRSNIKVIADIEMAEMKLDSELEMLILPGGLPGVDNLYACDKVRNAIEFCAENNIFIASICAAPSILGKMDLLKGKKATCYPGFEKYLEGAEIFDEAVVVDGKFITARSAGVSMQFSFMLVELLCGAKAREKLGVAIGYE